MSFIQFHDFGELYRAAFAETDERKKSVLLREVERIIHSKQQTDAMAKTATSKAA